MKIIVIGNSVGLMIRPPRNQSDDLHFAQIIKKKSSQKKLGITEIENRCKAGNIIDDIFVKDMDYLIGNSPEVVIVFLGINEAVSRPLPKFLYQPLNRERYVSNMVARFLQKINYGANKYLFPYLIRFFSLKGWYRQTAFVSRVEVFIEKLTKETKSLILFASILPCNDRIEAFLPGSKKSIIEFNKELKNSLSKYDNVELVEIKSDMLGALTETLVPDGIHMNSEAHKAFAEKILESVKSYFPN